jgi:hypothetical protein
VTRLTGAIHDDAGFHMLVDMLYGFIMKYEFSPTEIREAAMYAAVKYEMTNRRPYVFPNERNVSVDGMLSALNALKLEPR